MTSKYARTDANTDTDTDNDTDIAQLEFGLGRVELPLQEETDRGYLPVRIVIGGVAVILVIGLALGFGLPSRLVGVPNWAEYLSGVIGWTYFAAWSISFYPQIYTNYKRKSVVGLSFDFQLLNLIGFGFYAVFNCAFYFNDSIQKDYLERHNGNRNVVQTNDVFFALHAFAATLFTAFKF